MKLSRFWSLRGHREIEGLEPLETEAMLRAALDEPAAPGEDESYRRLMGVIAEDMRLRQPAPQRPTWAWMPAVSVAAAFIIFSVLAYTAGVDQGMKRMARILEDTPVVAPHQQLAKEPAVPSRPYIAAPPAPQKAEPARPEKPQPPSINIRELPEPSPMNYIGNLVSDGLTDVQRVLLRRYHDQAQAGDWDAAARSLERLADADLAPEKAITVLNGAAEIYRGRLRDDVEALRLYDRERQVIEDQLAEADTPERQASLQKQLEMVQASISAVRPVDPEPTDTETPAPPQ